MRWYSVRDIVNAYSITPDNLRRRIRSGKLKAKKVKMSVKNRGYLKFKYLIPETELASLKEFKLPPPKATPPKKPEVSPVAPLKRPFVDYYEYMRSEEWQAKRRLRLKLDGYQCQMCGSGTNLQVHHINYDNMCQDAEIDDLVTLCHNCHQKIHALDLERNRDNKLFVSTVKAIQEHGRDEAWQMFNKACKVCTPPLSGEEYAEIWLKALQFVYPL